MIVSISKDIPNNSNAIFVPGFMNADQTTEIPNTSKKEANIPPTNKIQKLRFEILFVTKLKTDTKIIYFLRIFKELVNGPTPSLRPDLYFQARLYLHGS